MKRDDITRAISLFAIACAATGCGSDPLLSDAAKLPSAPVDILIDEMGVPHVYAQNDDDAMFGAGYQMASDRLYQMEMLRRFALGRLSEVLGPDGFDRDRQARTFDFPRWGRADYELMKTADPERVRLLHAWVAGIDKRVDEVRSGAVERPFGYGAKEHDFLPERWEDVDPFIVLKGAGFALDKTIDFEIAISLVADVYPDPISAVNVLLPAHDTFAMPPDERPGSGPKMKKPAPDSGAHAAHELTPEQTTAAFAALSKMFHAMPHASGSNNWGIDGRFTASKKPIVAGDPHLSFDFFGAPYPLHINSADAGGSFDTAGFAYPGTPGIALGQNRKLVWTATSAFADVTDVWQVTRVGDSIKVGDKVAKVTTRDEDIIVRDPGAPAGQGQTTTVSYEDVEGYGVILPPELLPFPIGGPFLINWTGFTARPSRWFMELNRATSLDDFEAAVDRMREMDYSFVGADASGIAYRVGVDVPVRGDVSGDRLPWRVMNGDDAKSYWTGDMLARDRMPRSRAKNRGWIATANNDPFGFTGDGDITNDPYYYGAFFDPGYRATRIEGELDRLTKKGGITPEDVKALQTDLHTTLSDDLIPPLMTAHDHIATDPSLAELKGNADLESFVTLVKAWDRNMARKSAGALAWNAYLHFLAAEVIKDDIPAAFDFAMDLESVFLIKIAALGVLGKYPEGSKFIQGGPEIVMLRAAAKTAAWIKGRFGAIDATSFAYEDIKVTSFDDAFGYKMPVFDAPTDGGEDTIRVSQNISFHEMDPKWKTTYVSVERTVGAIGDDGTPELFVAFPVGAHADPNSADTKAALADYVDGGYRKLLFKRADVDAATAKRVHLD